MRLELRGSQLALAIATALSAGTIGVASADGLFGKPDGTYVAGDFHNHTTCSDGSISMQKLVKKATDKTDTPWGLDWFVQAGHGGNGNRNCTLVEDSSLATPAYPVVFSADGTTQLGPNTPWVKSNPVVMPKGLATTADCFAGDPTHEQCQNMWRWQSLQEFQYPVIEYLSALKHEPLFIGIESVVAGHEHSSMSVISGQVPTSIFSQKLPKTAGYTAIGNATALSQWEYCFDRGDTDTSRGNTVVGGTVGNNWDCSVAGSANSADVSWNATAHKLIPAGGAGNGVKGHAKTVDAIRWMQQNHPGESYYVPAHLERAGPFNPDGNNGFNVESLRDLNNAGPGIAFGFETQPGHGASEARGEYTVHRNGINGVNVDSVGGTTWGGTGVYGGQVGGVWDALLGEGRGYWFFASSDWHNRGSFGPDDRRSTQDFYPGEYQRTYVKVEKPTDNKGKGKADDILRPQPIVDGLRSGNAFAASGQLIDRLSFVACVAHNPPRPTPILDAIENALVETAAVIAAQKNTDVDVDRVCASMGEKLKVRRGDDVIVSIVVRDPSGTNYSPYTFPNPSLMQVGINQALNKPELDHVDVIRGMVSGYKQPGAADYSGAWPATWIQNPDFNTVPEAAKNTSAAVIRTFGEGTWSSVPGNREFKKMTFRIRNVGGSQYVRLRGTNMPPLVPFETDADGNPLADIYTNAAAVQPSKAGVNDGTAKGANLKIPCNSVGTDEFNGCPSHLFADASGQKWVSYDVAAWSDLWFYSNPIFVEVQGGQVVAGVK